MTPVSALAIGEMAPEFRLKGPAGQWVSLAEYRGQHHVVLVFYPLAFTPVCSHQLPELERERPRIEALGARVLGVSVDSWQTNEVFARQIGATFPLLSDFRRETSRAYGMLDEERFYSGRALFVIHRDGRLLYSDVSASTGDMAQIPSVERAIEVLQGLSR